METFIAVVPPHKSNSILHFVCKRESNKKITLLLDIHIRFLMNYETFFLFRLKYCLFGVVCDVILYVQQNITL